MSIWDHLFLTGEFRAREDLLSGLTLEQVTLRPTGASHSIYEELGMRRPFSAASSSRTKNSTRCCAAGRGTRARCRTTSSNGTTWYSSSWTEARAAIAVAQEPSRLAVEVEPGLTMGDELYCLAMHDAYHLGKIVALRQRIGAWPPKAAMKES